MFAHIRNMMHKLTEPFTPIVSAEPTGSVPTSGLDMLTF